MAIEIREMTIRDFDQVSALWKSMEGVGLDPEIDSRAGVKRFLFRNRSLSFVALEGKEIVAAALCGTDGRRGYLHHLAVKPSRRRRNIGRGLVDRCLSALKKDGINKCHIFVFAKNHQAIGFWKKIGWSVRKDLFIMSRPIREIVVSALLLT